MSERSPKERKERLCPICKKPVVERFKPFCSKRCADLDLAHWLKGDYAVAAQENDEDERPTEPEGGDE